MDNNYLKSSEVHEEAETEANKAPGIDFLLPARELPVSLEGPPCFYCSMTGHNPSECPSRLLTMNIRGLSRLGKLSFPELNSIYETVFPDYSGAVARLDTGITSLQLAHDQELLVLVSFLDINILYQLRFLFQIAFSIQPEWQKLEKAGQKNIDRRNLYLGLDYLRVGKYEEAWPLLKKETEDPRGKSFCANVALAFLVLEMGDFNNMVHYLKKAEILAVLEKERIYIGFLLSRYHQINEDVWRSRNALAIAEKSIYYSDQIAYRKIQLAVETGLDENSVNLLRGLMEESKEYFMTALMDPVFVPEQEVVENIASHHFSNIKQDAEKFLISLSSEFDKLGIWFDKEDEEQQERKKGLEELEGLFKHQAYYDLLVLVKESQFMLRHWQDIFFDQKEAFQRKVRRLEKNFKIYKSFWRDYKYPHFFSRFGHNLATASKKFLVIRRLVNENTVFSYKKALDIFFDLQQSVPELKSTYNRMIWMRTILYGIWVFGKSFFILEFILMSLSLFIGLGLEPALSEYKWGKIFADYDFQRITLSILAFLVVPLISLVITLIKLNKS
ncbi:MAG: hypothetical protein ACQES8_07505 [Thermodesulfobacteriota bacterium]